MQIIHDPQELHSISRTWRADAHTIALVPTMGFLHEGHLALMDKARELADKVMVSLFVNPTQFAPNEDFDRYPKSFERDCALAKAHGVDLLFVPDREQMYRRDHSSWVQVPKLSKGLCGASRPIHFRGVCTVVSKLFHLADPTHAIFGQKDWQQVAVLKRMVRDLDFQIKIIAHPIVREDDGLALSSRNVNLSEEARAQAPNIRRGLLELSKQVRNGERDAAILLAELRDFFAEHLPLGEIDYAEIVHPESLEQLNLLSGPALVAVAVHMPGARLIDNFVIEV